MHYVKLPATEEQRAKAEKKKAVEMAIYSKLKGRIFEKRDKGEFDEELLVMTGQLLERHPNVTTVWNLRRKILTLMCQKGSNESDEENLKRKDKLFNAELLLTEKFIAAKSKSYDTWFHRFWSLKQISKPDIAKELVACDKCLEIDERNFHCWDYRRDVVLLGNQSLEEEFKFCDNMINTNFSNYSAWHYRTSLLPVLFPDPENQLPVEYETLNDEFQKLQNAFFTDPEDQSAWVYAECLLLSDPDKSKCYIDNIHVLGLTFDFNVNRGSGLMSTYISLIFDRAVKPSMITDFMILKLKNNEQWTPSMDGKMTDHKRPISGSSSYNFEVTDEIVECQLRPSLKESYMTVDVNQGYINRVEYYHFYHIRRKPLSEARQEFIEKLIDSCDEILDELYDEKKRGVLKWPLFTYTLALVELRSEELHKTILLNLFNLATTIDPKRSEMYQEMYMNLQMNDRLREKIGDRYMIDVLFEDIDGHAMGCLKLQSVGIKSVDHLKHLSSFIKQLDVRRNKFTNLRPFKVLRCLTHLCVDDNPIGTLEDINLLPPLEYLSLVDTKMDESHWSVEIARKKVKTLKIGPSPLDADPCLKA